MVGSSRSPMSLLASFSRLNAFLFAFALSGLLFSSADAASCNLTGVAPSPSLINCVTSMRESLFPLLAGSSLVANEVGQFQNCEYNFPDTTMCIIDDVFLFEGGAFPLVHGMCVPDVCSPVDVAEFWHYVHCLNSTIQPFLRKHILPVWNETCNKLHLNATVCMGSYNYFEKDLELLVSQVIFGTEDVMAIDVHCGNNKVESWSAGGIVMLLLSGLLSALVLLNFILEIFFEGSASGSNSEEGASLLDGDPRSLGSLQVEPRRRSFLRRLVGQFSWRDNYDLLMKKEAARSLGCLDGMRTISMLWIILGHTGDFQGPGFVGFDSVPLYVQMFKRVTFQFNVSAQFCVDTFYFLSGLLTYYVLARKFAKSSKAPPLVLAIILRFLRLVPLVGFVIGFYTTIATHFGFGPMWYRFTAETAHCEANAWTNLLFINNFHPAKYGEQCMPWTWYLANDMQFFIAALVIFNVFYACSRKAGGLVMAVLTVASTFATLGYSYEHSLTMSSADGQDSIYDKPWFRFAPFGVGCLTAILFADVLKKSSPFENRRFLSFVLITLSIAGLLLIVYISHDFFVNGWTRLGNALYLGLTRVSFSIFLAIITTLCTYNAGGLVNWFLTRNFWEPLGKLTFGAYLVHPIVIRVAYFSLVHTVHYTDIEYGVYFVAFAVLSYSIALVLYLTVELPAAGLVSMMLPRK